VGEVDIDVVGDEQVQQPVAVVVEKSAAGSEARGVVEEAGLGRDVGEGAVSVVAVELVLSVVGDEQVLKAIVVVIAYADATAQPQSHRPASR